LKKINILAVGTDKKTFNLLFSKNYPSLIYENKTFLREDRNIGMVNFKKRLKKNNFNILTLKEYKIKQKKIDFEFHFYSNVSPITKSKLYLILPEHYLVDKNCKYSLIKKKYHKIFTNIKSHIDNKKFFFLNWPLSLKKKTKDYIKKKSSICMIASNKTLQSNSLKSGYSERIKIIKWFKKNHPGNLSLYGKGWDRPIFVNYFLSKILNFIFRKLNIQMNLLKNEYKGTCVDKLDVLKKYNFTFCIENVLNEKGYNTGQIFDALKANSIPIYYGRPDINKSIPKDCYIDYKKFSNTDNLYSFIANIDKKILTKYQKNIKQFCNQSIYDERSEFNEKNYSKILIKHLKKDAKK